MKTTRYTILIAGTAALVLLVAAALPVQASDCGCGYEPSPYVPYTPASYNGYSPANYAPYEPAPLSQYTPADRPVYNPAPYGAYIPADAPSYDPAGYIPYEPAVRTASYTPPQYLGYAPELTSEFEPINSAQAATQTNSGSEKTGRTAASQDNQRKANLDSFGQEVVDTAAQDNVLDVPITAATGFGLFGLALVPASAAGITIARRKK